MKKALKHDHQDIGDNLAKIAKHLAERVLKDPEGEERRIPLEDETAVFKVLTNYYAMLLKLDPPNPEEKADGSSWKSLARLGGTGGNGAKSVQF